MSWDNWIGRQRVESDQLTPNHAFQWCSTFDLEWPGDGVMPQGIHLALCSPLARTDCLGIDGHPARDDNPDSFFPPIALARRMWAASDMTFLSPIRLHARIDRVSRILTVSEKEGSTGKLGFVEVEHVTTADHVEAVREVQTLVYRGDAVPDAALSPPEPGEGSFEKAGWDSTRTLTPSETLLFRYSALTFNTHRIHYDLPYARDRERYRGLVVHGPLIASLLLQLAADRFGDNKLASFAFRAVSPAIAGEDLHLALKHDGKSLELGSFASDGRQTMQASATLA